MTIKLCDRCKKEINTNSLSNTQFPIIKITKSLFGVPTIEIDLCNDCVKLFEAWLEQES